MRDIKAQHAFFMRWAIALGEKGRITAPPNPWIGCVLVKEGEILGEGYHVAPGEPHAEIVALRHAGKLAHGARAYITLEPCAHTGRTPPCVDALIEAGVKEVVIPFLDPDPNVAGAGVRRLESAGVKVTLGVCADEAERALAPYLHHRRTGLPYVILKTATSIDGRTAAKDGSSKWITGEAARAAVMKTRAQSQAIMVGSSTYLHDKPGLLARGYERHPLRVIVDTRRRVDTREPNTLIFTSKGSAEEGVEVVGEYNGHVALTEVLTHLGKQGVIQLLVEGGSTLHSSFIHQRLAQELHHYIGSCLLGNEGHPLLVGESPPTIEAAPRLKLVDVQRLEGDGCLRCLFL